MTREREREREREDEKKHARKERAGGEKRDR